MKQFLSLMRHVLNEGQLREDRTGTGTISVFGTQSRYDLSLGFPLVTTKKVHLKSIIHELLWFLNGDTNAKYLQDNGVGIWNQWALEDGELGPIYGRMWTKWPVYEKPDDDDLMFACTDLVNMGATNKLDAYYYTIDQIQVLIDGIKNKPFSRRHILNAWNPQFLPDETISPHENVKNGKQCLPPCHTLSQFYVHNGKLSCQMYQRSGDLFLGKLYCPFV
ncbi:MAG: thymidylate synthase [Acidimicrobiia bacterium]|nr:thymidylate synthase [Acidimicrobiia bacterium]